MNLLNLSFFPIFAILAFVAVVLLVEGLYLMWNTYKGPEARKLEQRLRSLSGYNDSPGLTAVMKDRTLSNAPLIDRALRLVPSLHKVDRLLQQSGLEWTTAKVLFLSILSGILVFAAWSLFNLPRSMGLGLALLSMPVPVLYVMWKRRKRLRLMEQQLPDTLDLIGRALRAGHALPAGLQMAGQEMRDPIAQEFRTTNDEINFGVSLPNALMNLSERVPVTDVRYFVVAVLVQREAGGNLTEVLDSLSKLIRQRLMFHGRIKVLTTEGRMSAWVLALLPFAVAGMMNLVNHDFIKLLWTDPAGIMMTNAMLAMMAVGAFWLYRLVQIRV